MPKITLGNDIECSRVVKDVIIERKFAALDEIRLDLISVSTVPRHEIYATFLHASPVGLFDVRCNLGELIGGNFTGPVGLDSLLDFTVCTFQSERLVQSS